MKKSNVTEVFQAFNEINSAFGGLTEWYARGVQESSGLTLKQRAFMSIACDVCEQTLYGPLEFHIKMALENGATRQDVKEAILHMGVYGAYPKCFETIARLKELYTEFDKKGLYLTGDKVSHPKPEHNWILDTDVKDGLIAFEPQYGDLSSRMAGEVWGRPGLTPMERVYISISGDVCQQTLSADGPFPFHANLCLQNGMTQKQVREMIMYLTVDVGFLRVWNALEALNAHFTRLDSQIAEPLAGSRK
ncbi:carboxymuconolactone decarboxylase family protein [Chlorogloeopsis fritschii]|uniref:carboxymuconolactone decarboxylase family protein n=1 Tax=Chlorogloeopsis fritschii TaxID=1124 RepID=UPI00031C00F9|nr:carboxymuconolactone decarboxylase family protein [Chlorogloeopsis fritschii]